MWMRGSRRRPPRSPRGQWGYKGAAGAGYRRPQENEPLIRSKAGRPWGGWVWRKFRRRLKALWRWMVVRTVRTLMHRLGARGERSEPGLPLGEVRRFPNER